MAQVLIKFPFDISAKIVKWKVKTGVKINIGTVLALYQPRDAKNPLKLKSIDVGTVTEVLIAEGSLVKASGDLLKIEPCTHQTVMKDMCAECGKDLKLEDDHVKKKNEKTSASVAMVHCVPELVISEKQALELGQVDEKRMLMQKKLALLVDLDQTLIHTTNDLIPANLQDVEHFQLYHGPNLLWYHTKFRPGTKKFLEKMSSLFELHICTFGVRMYAHTIARFLDPDGKFFSTRILSRDECFDPRSKTANLKALFPCGDSMVCIIDDREDVWNFSANIVPVKPYLFFDGTADINAPPGMDKKNEAVGKPKRKVIVHRVPKKGANETPEGIGDKLESAEEKQDGKDEKKKETASGEVQEIEMDEACDTDPKDEMITENMNDDETEKLDVKQSKDGADVKDERTDETEVKVEQKGETEVKVEQKGETEGNVEQKGEAEVKVEQKGEAEVKVEQKCEAEVKVEQKCETKVTVEQKCETEVTVEQKCETEVTVEQKCETEVTVEQKGEMNETAVAEESNNECKVSKDKKTDKLPADGESTEAGGVIPDGCIEDVGATVNLEDDLDLSGDEKDGGNADTQFVKVEQFDEVIEWEDSDDYLLYLEDILTRVHTAYFQFYKQTKESAKSEAKVELPTVKNVIPYVKRKTLQGVNILFSGVIPTNAVAVKSRAYTTAIALGATIHEEFVPGKSDKDEERTTHVVAARAGTIKVKRAQKHRYVTVVNSDWLWTCNERWEHVDERLYPLSEEVVGTRDVMPRKKGHKRKISGQQQAVYDRETGKKLKKDVKIAKLDEGNDSTDKKDDGNETTPDTTAENSADDDTSGEESGCEGMDDQQVDAIIQRRFSETYNPIATFSTEDLSNMDKEVDEIFGESDDSDSSSVRSEKELRNKVLGIRPPDLHDSSDNDSLTGDYPLGWGMNRKPLKSPLDENGEEKGMDWGDHHPEKAREEILQRADSSTDMSDADSIGSVDEEMAAALEKELLA